MYVVLISNMVRNACFSFVIVKKIIEIAIRHISFKAFRILFSQMEQFSTAITSFPRVITVKEYARPDRIVLQIGFRCITTSNYWHVDAVKRLRKINIYLAFVFKKGSSVWNMDATLLVIVLKFYHLTTSFLATFLSAMHLSQ